MLSAIVRLLKILTIGLEIKKNTFYSSFEVRDTVTYNEIIDISNCKENDFFIKCDLDEPVYINFYIDGATDSTPRYFINGEWVATYNKLILGGDEGDQYEQYYINSFFPFLKNMNIKSLKMRVKAVSAAPTSGSITIVSHSKLI